MSNTARFGTALNCMDGRVQDAVGIWLKEHYQLDYVDMITEPGMDRLMVEGPAELLAAVRAKIDISINRHHSNIVALAGHHDCSGNPVSKEEHLKQIAQGLQTLRFWNLPVTVVGLWVNEQWQAEAVNS